MHVLQIGTGDSQASAVTSALENWNLVKTVLGVYFDTTASNTGPHAGACVLIERRLRRLLLHFSSRHHVFEISLGDAVEFCIGPCNAPEILLSKRFKVARKNLDTNK